MKYKKAITLIKIYWCKKFESNMEWKHLGVHAERDDKIYGLPK